MSIADTIRAGIAAGKSNAEVLEAVKAAHPASNTSPACVSFYRSKMKKEGNAAPTPPRAASAKAKPAKAAKVVQLPPGARLGYHVAGVKSFIGMEGHGYNATLYFEGKKVAFVIDDAGGGPLDVQWEGPRDQTRTIDGGNGKVWHVKATAAELALEEAIKGLPDVVCSFDDPNTGRPATLAMTAELFIDDLVNAAQALKDVRKAIKAGIMFAAEGKVYSTKCDPQSEKVRAQIRRKHPDARMLNDMDEREALDLYLATLS